MLYMSESIRPLTSIVSYPERGEGGNNKYRGNCSPKLIEDLIGFFKPSEICDYMCGSGTTGWLPPPNAASAVSSTICTAGLT